MGIASRLLENRQMRILEEEATEALKYITIGRSREPTEVIKIVGTAVRLAAWEM
jgi:hypothetical protein